MSNYMLGCRLIDCFLTLLMLDLKAASRHEALRSFNKKLPDPGMPSLPGRDEVKTKGVGGLLVIQSCLQKKKKKSPGRVNWMYRQRRLTSWPTRVKRCVW